MFLQFGRKTVGDVLPVMTFTQYVIVFIATVTTVRVLARRLHQILYAVATEYSSFFSYFNAIGDFAAFGALFLVGHDDTSFRFFAIISQNKTSVKQGRRRFK